MTRRLVTSCTVVALGLFLSLLTTEAKADTCSYARTKSKLTVLEQALRDYSQSIVARNQDAALHTSRVAVELNDCLPDNRLGEVARTHTIYMTTLVENWVIRLNCEYLCAEEQDELIEWVTLHELCHIEQGSTHEDADVTARARLELAANQCAFAKKRRDEDWLLRALSQYLNHFPNQATDVNSYIDALR